MASGSAPSAFCGAGCIDPALSLIHILWSNGAEFVEENALSVTIKRLRGKLEEDPSRPEYLKTVYGLGYTWAVQP